MTPRLYGALTAKNYKAVRMNFVLRHWRLYVTRSGGFGLCPNDTRVDDTVLYLFDAHGPAAA